MEGVGEPRLKPAVMSVAYRGLLVDEKVVMANFQTAVEGYGFVFAEIGTNLSILSSLGKRLVLRVYNSDLYRAADYREMQYSNVGSVRRAQWGLPRVRV